MTRYSTIFLAMSGLILASTAHAQTAAVPNVPSTTQPNTAQPNAPTAPNGIARGVIRPNRPVDSGMVKHPPTNGQHKMPVIRPPGTAR